MPAKDTVLKKNNGQALVEFVLIIPIIIMILFVVIDFSFVFYNKNHLEGVLDDVVSYVEKGKTTDEIKSVLGNDYDYSIKINDGFATVEIKKDVNLITPFANTFFDNPYHLSSSRVIIYE